MSICHDCMSQTCTCPGSGYADSVNKTCERGDHAWGENSRCLRCGESPDVELADLVTVQRPAPAPGELWKQRNGEYVRVIGFDVDEAGSSYPMIVKNVVDGSYGYRSMNGLAAIPELSSKDLTEKLGPLLSPEDPNSIRDFETYERLATPTWRGRMPGTEVGLYHLSLKLAGEAGEFCEHLGKALRDDQVTIESIGTGKLEFTPERRKALLKELGDELWYVTVLARHLGSSLQEVAQMNAEKTMDRDRRGVTKGSGDDR